jgi:hypothetical protein
VEVPIPLGTDCRRNRCGRAPTCTDLHGWWHGHAQTCTDTRTDRHGCAQTCTDLHGLARTRSDCHRPGTDRLMNCTDLKKNVNVWINCTHRLLDLNSKYDYSQHARKSILWSYDVVEKKLLQAHKVSLEPGNSTGRSLGHTCIKENLFEQWFSKCFTKSTLKIHSSDPVLSWTYLYLHLWRPRLSKEFGQSPVKNSINKLKLYSCLNRYIADCTLIDHE